MIWFFLALAILLICGVASLLLGRRPKAACAVGAIGALAGGGIVLTQSVWVLVSGQSQACRAAWPLPFGSADVELDPLSAFFAALISLVTMLAAVYGSGYLKAYAGKKNLGPPWFFFQFLTASMLAVVAARNGVLFLLSWELMSLASFFLVMFEDEKESVRRAGWMYLAAMHLGTAFLIAMFLLLGRNADSLDFGRLSAAGAPAGVIFVLALVGFGTKAGFFPLHVWLPEAHPAAPSHVSAVMSGVMIKTGIYGLLRVLTFLGEPAAWWGWTLVGIGIASGVLGILYALSQQHIKRLLAYCSMENVGIIALALGVGLLGAHRHNPVMATLGFMAALLHALNHAVFKSLLFFGAGSILHAAHTGDVNRLGGLLKRMRTTGTAFAIGAAAICGLPPLNGFVSEFLIYLGAMAGLGDAAGAAATWPLLGIAAIGGLSLIGGLAVACFAGVFGVAFLGEPRCKEAAEAREVGLAMRGPMAVLAALCVLIGLAAPVWPMVLQPAVAALVQISSGHQETGRHAKQSLAVSQGTVFPLSTTPLNASERTGDLRTPLAHDALSATVKPLVGVVFGSYILLGLVVLLAAIRWKLLAGRRVEQSGTWDCGYAAPTPRMQYTASSFARPIVLMFRLFLRTRDANSSPQGFFPSGAELHTRTSDWFRRRIYDPMFALAVRLASKLRRLQEGRIQFYVLYIALTILVLLIWKLRQQ